MRVAVADDAMITREGLLKVLAAVGAEVVAAASNGSDLLLQIRDDPPDVAVLDIQMPSGTDGGLDTAEALRARHPGVGILMLSAYLRMAYAVRLFAHGEAGLGYLLKDKLGDLDKLNNALHQLANGGTVMDVDVITKLMEHRRLSGELDRLTSRERDVLSLMAQGASNQHIGNALFIDRKTVETHVSNIFAKLNLTRVTDDKRVLAVLAWLRMNKAR